MRAAPLFPIRTSSGHGLIDCEGRVVVTPTLTELGALSDGLASASVGYGKVGFVDETGPSSSSRDSIV